MGDDVVAVPSPSPQEILEQTKRISLGLLVSVGTVLVALLGLALFGWFAWLLSHQAAPWHDPAGWSAWLSHVDGPALFDAARTSATVVAVVGVGGAALVAYRRQDTAERSHDVAIHQLKVDSQKYGLDRDRHQLETERQKDAREQELRARFTTVAAQLGSKDYAVRHAGAYALAFLADDWHRFGNDIQRQVCVDLLCAQLRSPRVPDPAAARLLEPKTVSVTSPRANPADFAQDVEVRKTLVALLRSHRPVNDVEGQSDWKSCTVDLTGADLSTFNFLETDLSSAILDDANLTHANLTGANLSDAMMARVTLSGTSFAGAKMAGAKLYSARIDRAGEEDHWKNQTLFGRADLRGAWFTSAFLPNAEFDGADLTGAILHSAKLMDASFIDATVAGARFLDADLTNADFTDADVSSAIFTRAQTEGANFQNARDDDETRWPHNIRPENLFDINNPSPGSTWVP